jgi:hypothetical protein
MTKVFISYSQKDRRWLTRLLVHLKPLERDGRIDLWADTRIKPGEDWGEEIESALLQARVAILLVSADFLASEFIASKELPRLVQKSKRGECRVLCLVVGPCLFSQIRDLQPLQAINSPDRPLAKIRKAEAEGLLLKTAEAILKHLPGGGHRAPDRPLHENAAMTDRTARRLPAEFIRDPRIDDLIKAIKLADWDLAAEAALRVVAMTDSEGCNKTFESLLNYQDCPDEDDAFWGALHTIESCTRLAPWLIDHAKLSRLARHDNFSVRSAAASICMDLAHSAPDRVPLDILLKLSVYDEDWYVQAPANAALKAMARSFPAVLGIFYLRLHSLVGEERAHAAAAIEDVADKEPGLLDPELLGKELVRLKKLGDARIHRRMGKVLLRLKSATRTDTYRYGL